MCRDRAKDEAFLEKEAREEEQRLKLEEEIERYRKGAYITHNHRFYTTPVTNTNSVVVLMRPLQTYRTFIRTQHTHTHKHGVPTAVAQLPTRCTSLRCLT